LTKLPKTYNREKAASSTNVAAICLQKTETRSMPVTCTSINSKDFNIRPETLKLVQERPGNSLETIGIGKDFLSRTQAAQQLRERMDKWDCMKLKTSAQQKKWSPTEWEKILASYTSD
jgi:hypothetical protein